MDKLIYISTYINNLALRRQPVNIRAIIFLLGLLAKIKSNISSHQFNIGYSYRHRFGNLGPLFIQFFSVYHSFNYIFIKPLEDVPNSDALLISLKLTFVRLGLVQWQGVCPASERPQLPSPAP